MDTWFVSVFEDEGLAANSTMVGCQGCNSCNSSCHGCLGCHSGCHSG